MAPTDDEQRHDAVPVPGLSLEELGARVREVERIAAFGCRLAREALADPLQSERIQARLQALLRDVNELVPPSTWNTAPVDPRDLVAPSIAAQGVAEDGQPVAQVGQVEVDQAEADEAAGGEVGDEEEELEGDEEESDDDEQDDEEQEWDFDPNKLAAAINNEALMSGFREEDREWFRATARRAIEAHARGVLATRVKDAIGELYETMSACHEEAEKRLAVALTFEELRSRVAQKKAD